MAGTPWLDSQHLERYYRLLYPVLGPAQERCSPLLGRALTQNLTRSVPVSDLSILSACGLNYVGDTCSEPHGDGAGHLPAQERCSPLLGRALTQNLTRSVPVSDLSILSACGLNYVGDTCSEPHGDGAGHLPAQGHGAPALH